jgi:5-methylcytosine-specific restriction endonuclease McrA
MARTREEWIGKNDDSRPPQSVQIRLFESSRGYCQACGLKLKPGNWHIDHKVRLKDGDGNNRERNLQIICVGCHQEKTGQENHDQAKADRIKAGTIGVKKASSRPVPGSRNSPWKAQSNARGGSEYGRVQQDRMD